MKKQLTKLLGVFYVLSIAVSKSTGLQDVSWVLPDALATVGRVFQYQIPRIDNATQYYITEAGSDRLPPWIQYQPSTHTLQGVPLVQDEGFIYISVSTANKEPPYKKITDVFSIDVRLPRTHHHYSSHTQTQPVTQVKPEAEIFKRVECRSDQGRYYGSLIFDAKINLLKGISRVDLVQVFADLVSKHQDDVRLSSRRSSTVSRLLNSDVITAGPGNVNHTTLAAGKSTHGVELTWPLACGGFPKLNDFVRVITHNIEVGTISNITGLGVIGWYVTREQPNIRSQKMPLDRRKRQALIATPVPTPTVTIAPPTAYMSTSSIAQTTTEPSRTSLPTNTVTPVLSSIIPSSIKTTDYSFFPSKTAVFTPLHSSPVLSEPTSSLSESMQQSSPSSSFLSVSPSYSFQDSSVSSTIIPTTSSIDQPMTTSLETKPLSLQSSSQSLFSTRSSTIDLIQKSSSFQQPYISTTMEGSMPTFPSATHTSTDIVAATTPVFRSSSTTFSQTSIEFSDIHPSRTAPLPSLSSAFSFSSSASSYPTMSTQFSLYTPDSSSRSTFLTVSPTSSFTQSKIMSSKEMTISDLPVSSSTRIVFSSMTLPPTTLVSATQIPSMSSVLSTAIVEPSQSSDMIRTLIVPSIGLSSFTLFPTMVTSAPSQLYSLTPSFTESIAKSLELTAIPSSQMAITSLNSEEKVILSFSKSFQSSAQESTKLISTKLSSLKESSSYLSVLKSTEFESPTPVLETSALPQISTMLYVPVSSVTMSTIPSVLSTSLLPTTSFLHGETASTTFASSMPSSQTASTIFASSVPASTTFASSISALQSASTTFAISMPASQIVSTTFESSVTASQIASTTFASSVPASQTASTTFASSIPALQSASTTFAISMPASQIVSTTFESSVTASQIASTTFASSVPASQTASTTLVSSMPASQTASTFASSVAASTIFASSVSASQTASQTFASSLSSLHLPMLETSSLLLRTAFTSSKSSVLYASSSLTKSPLLSSQFMPSFSSSLHDTSRSSQIRTSQQLTREVSSTGKIELTLSNFISATPDRSLPVSTISATLDRSLSVSTISATLDRSQPVSMTSATPVSMISATLDRTLPVSMISATLDISLPASFQPSALIPTKHSLPMGTSLQHSQVTSLYPLSMLTPSPSLQPSSDASLTLITPVSSIIMATRSVSSYGKPLTTYSSTQPDKLSSHVIATTSVEIPHDITPFISQTTKSHQTLSLLTSATKTTLFNPSLITVTNSLPLSSVSFSTFPDVSFSMSSTLSSPLTSSPVFTSTSQTTFSHLPVSSPSLLFSLFSQSYPVMSSSHTHSVPSSITLPSPLTSSSSSQAFSSHPPVSMSSPTPALPSLSSLFSTPQFSQSYPVIIMSSSYTHSVPSLITLPSLLTSSPIFSSSRSSQSSFTHLPVSTSSPSPTLPSPSLFSTQLFSRSVTVVSSSHAHFVPSFPSSIFLLSSYQPVLSSSQFLPSFTSSASSITHISSTTSSPAYPTSASSQLIIHSSAKTFSSHSSQQLIMSSILSSSISESISLFKPSSRLTPTKSTFPVKSSPITLSSYPQSISLSPSLMFSSTLTPTKSTFPIESSSPIPFSSYLQSISLSPSSALPSHPIISSSFPTPSFPPSLTHIKSLDISSSLTNLNTLVTESVVLNSQASSSSGVGIVHSSTVNVSPVFVSPVSSATAVLPTTMIGSSQFHSVQSSSLPTTPVLTTKLPMTSVQPMYSSQQVTPSLTPRTTEALMPTPSLFTMRTASVTPPLTDTPFLSTSFSTKLPPQVTSEAGSLPSTLSPTTQTQIASLSASSIMPTPSLQQTIAPTQSIKSSETEHVVTTSDLQSPSVASLLPSTSFNIPISSSKMLVSSDSLVPSTKSLDITPSPSIEPTTLVSSVAPTFISTSSDSLPTSTSMYSSRVASSSTESPATSSILSTSSLTYSSQVASSKMLSSTESPEMSSILPARTSTLSLQVSSSVTATSSTIHQTTSKPLVLSSSPPVLSSSPVVSSSLPVALTSLPVSSSLPLVSPTPSPVQPSSSFMMSSSIIPVITTQEPVNQPPILLNPVDKVEANLGQFLHYPIPPHTFYDPEDGYTPDLTLSLLDINHAPVAPYSWLQLDAVNQVLYGVPLNTTIIAYDVEYYLAATDTEGLVTYDAIVVVIVPSTVIYNHVFEVEIDNSYPNFISDGNNIVKLGTRIANFYSDVNASALYVDSLVEGSVIMGYSNMTLDADICDIVLIDNLYDQMAYSNGTAKLDFNMFLSLEFPVLFVNKKLQGSCDDFIVTTPAANVTAVPIGDDVNLVVVIVVPALIVALLILFCCCILCCWYKRSRAGDEFLLREEKPTYAKNRKPVFLNDELTGLEPRKPSRPVVLPDDISPFTATPKPKTPNDRKMPRPPSYHLPDYAKPSYTNPYFDHHNPDMDYPSTKADLYLVDLPSTRLQPPQYTLEPEYSEPPLHHRNSAMYSPPPVEIHRPPPRYTLPPPYDDEDSGFFPTSHV